MQNFPIIKSDQVVLMRADTHKGYVLDESLAVATNDKQVVYTVINDFNSAIALANQITKEHIDIECVIYDSNQKVLSFLRPAHFKDK